MDEATIRALIASSVATEVAAALAKLPPVVAPDLSVYALRADIPTVPDISALEIAVADHASAIRAITEKPDAEPDRETTRLGLWLKRIASKWHADERPTDADVEAALDGAANDRG